MAATKSLEVVQIAPSEIEIPSVSASPGRFAPVNEQRLSWMAWSMRTHGQEQPIRVRKNAKGDGYIGVFGFTRIAAGQMIEQTGFEYDGKTYSAVPDFTLRAEVVDTKAEIDDTDRLIENIGRNALSPMDHAINMARYMEVHGVKQKALTKVWGWNTAQISRHVRLLNLPRDVQEKVHEYFVTKQAVNDGDEKAVVSGISFLAATELLKDDYGFTPEEMSELANRENLTAADVYEFHKAKLEAAKTDTDTVIADDADGSQTIEQHLSQTKKTPTKKKTADQLGDFLSEYMVAPKTAAKNVPEHTTKAVSQLFACVLLYSTNAADSEKNARDGIAKVVKLLRSQDRNAN